MRNSNQSALEKHVNFSPKPCEKFGASLLKNFPKKVCQQTNYERMNPFLLISSISQANPLITKQTQSGKVLNPFGVCQV